MSKPEVTTIKVVTQSVGIHCKRKTKQTTERQHFFTSQRKKMNSIHPFAKFKEVQAYTQSKRFCTTLNFAIHTQTQLPIDKLTVEKMVIITDNIFCRMKIYT